MHRPFRALLAVLSFSVLTAVTVFGGGLFGLVENVRAADRIIPFSARMRSSSGAAAAPDGNYSITFRIYNQETGGVAAWEEAKTVSVVGGSFSTFLGSVTPLPSTLVFSSENYYLAVQVESDSEMSPRQRIGAVPLALDATTVEGKVPGMGPGNLLALDVNGGFQIQGGITVGNSIIPSSGGVNLGSSSNRFGTIYVDNLNVAAADLSGTSSQAFSINTGQATNNTDISKLRFYLGPVENTYAALQWNGPANQFEFLARENASQAANVALNGLLSAGTVSASALSITGPATITGTATLGVVSASSFSSSGNVLVGGTLGITGATSLAGLSTSGAATLNSLSVTNAASVGGSLSVTSGITIGGTLAVTGASTLGSVGVNELAVTGASTLAGTSISGNLAVGGSNFTVNSSTGNTSIGGTLAVTGGASLSTVSSSGAANLNSLAVTNASSLQGDLTVAGASELQGAVDLQGNVIVGTDSSNTLTLNARLASGLIPAADAAYDLGSPSFRFNNFYAASAVFDSLDTPATIANDFYINSDNATADTEDSRLLFHRGSTTPHASIAWDSTNKKFVLNQALDVQGNTTLGSSSSDSSVVRGQLALTDSNSSHPLLFGSGSDVALFKNASNELRSNAAISLGPIQNASSGVTTSDSRGLVFNGSYWNGTAATNVSGGIYLKTTGATPSYGVAIQTGGTDRVFVGQNGNVGIGTNAFSGQASNFVISDLTSSNTGMQIVSGQGTTYIRNGTNGLNIQGIHGVVSLLSSRLAVPLTSNVVGATIQASSSQTANLQEWRNNSGTVLSSITAAGAVAGGTLADSVLTLQGNTAASGNTAGNAAINFAVGNGGATTAMTILNNGSVGIGGSSSSRKLYVNGDAEVSGDVVASNLRAVGAGGLSIYTQDNVRGIFVEQSTGNVAIGTSGTPIAKLDVAGSVRLGAAGGSNDILNTVAAGGVASGSLFWGNQALVTSGNIGTYGVSTLNGLSGTLTINNSSGSGSAITIDNAAADGSTKGIATFNATNFSAVSGVINTVQNIDSTATPSFSALSLTSGAITMPSTTSATAPLVTFSGDTDTGIGRSAADTINFITGGSTRGNFGSNGVLSLNNGLVTTGNALNTGYLRVGSASAPSNTAGGDITGARLNLGNVASSSLLYMGGDKSAAAWGTAGIQLQAAAGTYTDTSSSGTVANVAINSIAQSTIAASSVTTYTSASTLYVAGPPTAGTNVTISQAAAATLVGFVAVGADAGTALFNNNGAHFVIRNLSQNNTGMQIQSAVGTSTWRNGSEGTTIQPVGQALNIDGNLLPLSSASFDFGSASRVWKNGYFGSGVSIGSTVAPRGKLDLIGAVTGSANYGFLNLGPAATAFDGSTSGFFAGSSSGTWLAVNAASGFAGNLADMQVAGSSKFKVDASGNLTIAGTTITGTSSLSLASSSNGDINVTPNGTGKIKLNTSGNVSSAVFIGDGGTSNYAKFDTNGALTFAGAARPYSELTLNPADAVVPGSNGCTLNTTDDTNHSFKTLDCAASADQWANWQLKMSQNYVAGSNVQVDVYWTDTASNTTNNGPRFDVGYTAVANAADWVGASRTDVTGAVVNSAGQNKVTTSTVTLTSPTINANDLLNLRVLRKGTVDTLADTVKIVEVRIRYLVGS